MGIPENKQTWLMIFKYFLGSFFFQFFPNTFSSLYKGDKGMIKRWYKYIVDIIDPEEFEQIKEDKERATAAAIAEGVILALLIVGAAGAVFYIKYR